MYKKHFCGVPLAEIVHFSCFVFDDEHDPDVWENKELERAVKEKIPAMYRPGCPVSARLLNFPCPICGAFTLYCCAVELGIVEPAIHFAHICVRTGCPEMRHFEDFEPEAILILCPFSHEPEALTERKRMVR